jgi:recombination protein RecA
VSKKKSPTPIIMSVAAVAVSSSTAGAAAANKSTDANAAVAKAIGAIIGKAQSRLSLRDGLSSGSLFLNYMLTGNYAVAYPHGKIIELLGAEGSGKTTLAAHAVLAAQAAGMPQYWYDAETNLDTQYEYFKAIGIDMDNMPHSDAENPPVMEIALKQIMTVLEMGGLAVVDSVPAMIPKKQDQREFGGGFQTARAALLSESLPILRSVARKGRGILMLINQFRADMNGGDKGAGGKALPYYADARITLKSWAMNAIKGTLSLSDIESNEVRAKHSDTRLGVTVIADIIKNKFYPPFGRAKIDITYGKGIDAKKDVVFLGAYTGVVETVTAKQAKYNGKNYSVESMSSELLKEILTKAQRVERTK